MSCASSPNIVPYSYGMQFEHVVVHNVASLRARIRMLDPAVDQRMLDRRLHLYDRRQINQFLVVILSMNTISSTSDEVQGCFIRTESRPADQERACDRGTGSRVQSPDPSLPKQRAHHLHVSSLGLVHRSALHHSSHTIQRETQKPRERTGQSTGNWHRYLDAGGLESQGVVLAQRPSHAFVDEEVIAQERCFSYRIDHEARIQNARTV
mmetsp:Transcript_10644/g.29383  ORF Transcript_10644/g.29383 Transcript_10644/m.29383 type:complete len:209 (+) Transcript_10644:964-1590(+)